MEWSDHFIKLLADKRNEYRAKFPSQRVSLYLFVRAELNRRRMRFVHHELCSLVELVRKELKRRTDAERRLPEQVARAQQAFEMKVISYTGDPSDLDENADDVFVREVKKLPWVQRGDHLLADP